MSHGLVFFQYGAEDAGGVGHVPPGWSFWYALVCDHSFFKILKFGCFVIQLTFEL